MEDEIYVCELCGVKMTWEEKDDVHGEMWGCEECGNTVCSKCLRDAIGQEKYIEMMQSGEEILCADCVRKRSREHNEKTDYHAAGGMTCGGTAL